MITTKVLDRRWTVPIDIDEVTEQWPDSNLRAEIDGAIFDCAGYEIHVKIWKVKKAQT
jgi:hypothetical protein